MHPLRAFLITCLVTSVAVLCSQVAAAPMQSSPDVLVSERSGTSADPQTGEHRVAPDKSPHFPELTGRVVDEAEIIEPSDEWLLTNLLARYESDTTNQIVVVTVKSLGGTAIEHFSFELGNDWGIGHSKKNNGVLLVVAPVERQMRIEVGLGLQDMLTDVVAKRILDDVVAPRFRSQQASFGIVSGILAIIMAIENTKDSASSEVQSTGASTANALGSQPSNTAAVEEPSSEILARELAQAYDRNDFRAVESLTVDFDEKLDILFESGELERAVRLVQVVKPTVIKWIERARSSVDIEPTVSQLVNWTTLEMLARNQAEPTQIMLARSIAKDEMPLQITVEGGTSAKIYRLFEKSEPPPPASPYRGHAEWIGQTPQYVILSPGLNRLVLYFDFGGDVGVDFTLDGDRVRADVLYNKLYKMPNPSNTLAVLRSSSRQGRAEDEMISSLLQRYPPSSVLQRKENNLPSFEVPRPPIVPSGEGGRGAGPLGIVRTAYRKVQIESDPTGASILINGEPRGTTPRAILLSFKQQLPRIQMILTKPGYLETVAEVNLMEAATAVHAKLNPLP